MSLIDCIDSHLIKEGYDLSDISSVVNHLEEMANARIAVLKAIYIYAGRNENKLFNNLCDIGMKAPTARRIAKYLCYKYFNIDVNTQQKIAKQKLTPPDQVEETEPGKMELFIGQRIYHSYDTAATYLVMVTKTKNIILKKFSGDTVEDSEKLLNTYSGTVNEDGTIVISGSKIKFKFCDPDTLCEFLKENYWYGYYIKD